MVGGRPLLELRPEAGLSVVHLVHAERRYKSTRVLTRLERGATLRWDEMWLNSPDELGDDEYKFNNTYTSRLGRLAVQVAPDVADLFEFRQLKSA